MADERKNIVRLESDGTLQGSLVCVNDTMVENCLAVDWSIGSASPNGDMFAKATLYMDLVPVRVELPTGWVEYHYPGPVECIKLCWPTWRQRLRRRLRTRSCRR